MSKFFPAWAPPKLSSWYDILCMFNGRSVTSASHDKWQIRKLGKSLPNAETAELVHRWGSLPCMKDAWKRVADEEGPALDDAAYYICYHAISHLAHFRSVKPITMAARKQHFTKIAQLSNELISALDECEELRECAVVDFMDDAMVERLAHGVCNVSFGPGTDFVAAGKRGPCNLHATRIALNLTAPPVPALLFGIAERALIECTQPPISAHTTGKDPEINYLIRALTKLLEKEAWVAKDEIVRALVQAIYPTLDISLARVRTTRNRAARVAS